MSDINLEKTILPQLIAITLPFTIGIMGISITLSLIVGGVYKLFGRNFTKESFNWTLLVTWAFFAFIFIASHSNEQLQIN